MQSHKRPFTLFLTPKVFHLIILQRRWLKDTGRVNTGEMGRACTHRHFLTSSTAARAQER